MQGPNLVSLASLDQSYNSVSALARAVSAPDFPSLNQWIMSRGFDVTLLNRKYLLHVQIVEGLCVRASDTKALSDAYCKLAVGKVKLRTKTVKQDLNPIWDQSFTFPVTNVCEDDFLLTCWNRDQFSRAEFLGKVRVLSRSCVSLLLLLLLLVRVVMVMAENWS